MQQGLIEGQIFNRGISAMAHELPAKLRLTAVLLGCTPGKELCARFRAVNHTTAFDLERSRKWLQGRALPRQAQVYEDWAKLLGTSRGGGWLAACTLEAFLEEVSALFDADPGDLLRQADRLGARAAAGLESQQRASHLLSGVYAAYSHAWSPYHRGQLIRGALSLAPGKGSSLVATYSELFTGQPVRWSGPAEIARGTLNLDLREAGSNLPLFICAFQPRPPAGACVGIMSGASFIGPEPRPSSTRIVFVRTVKMGAVAIERSNRYFEATPAGVASDLRALGLPAAGSRDAAALLATFLMASPPDRLDQVPAVDQVQLAEAFDALYLEALAREDDAVHHQPAHGVGPQRSLQPEFRRQ